MRGLNSIITGKSDLMDFNKVPDDDLMGFHGSSSNNHGGIVQWEDTFCVSIEKTITINSIILCLMH